jgi:hypothetical protein
MDPHLSEVWAVVTIGLKLLLETIRVSCFAIVLTILEVQERQTVQDLTFLLIQEFNMMSLSAGTLQKNLPQEVPKRRRLILTMFFLNIRNS